MSLSLAKQVILSLSLLIFSLSANASPELKRINLLVSDLDRSLEIYEGVIGMEVFALIEVTKAGLPSQDGIKMATAVIKINNLKEIYNQINDLELKTTRIDEDTTPEGRTFLEFSFVDYDGNLIVLYELK